MGLTAAQNSDWFHGLRLTVTAASTRRSDARASARENGHDIQVPSPSQRSRPARSDRGAWTGATDAVSLSTLRHKAVIAAAAAVGRCPAIL